MYVKARHGKTGSSLIAYLEKDRPGVVNCLGRSQRYGEEDQDHWEWIRLESKDNGGFYVSVQGWGSALGDRADRLIDVIMNPSHWHPGIQPETSQQTLGDFKPCSAEEVAECLA